MLKAIDSIQGLRAYAAIIVVTTHALSQINHIYSQSLTNLYLKDFLSSGVDVFFVISGFIMFYTSKKMYGKKNSYKIFLTKRIIRVLPIYWLMSLAYLALFAVQGLIQGSDAVFWERVNSWHHLLSSALLLPTLNYSGEPAPILGVGWTLIFEMYFYAIFALTLAVFTNAILALIFIIGFFSVSSLIQLYLGFDSPIALFYLNPITLEFCMGGIVALIFMSSFKTSKRVAFILLVMAIMGFSYSIINGVPGGHSTLNNYRAITWGIPSALLVFSILMLEKSYQFSTPKMLKALGDSSYTLYLSHAALTLPMCAFIYPKIGFDKFIPQWLLLVITLLICIGIAHVLYLLIEKPITHYLKRKFSS